MEYRYAPAGLSKETASRVADKLQERLSSLIDLSMTLKHIHWNVVGPGFIAIHKLMDEQNETVLGLIDEVAERIVTLGGIAAGLPNQVGQFRDAGEDYALGRAPVLAHLGALDKTYERLGSGHRDAIEKIDEIDPVTGDLLISQTAALEMNHWFIRAHLTNVDGELSTEAATDELDAAAEAVQAALPGEEPAERILEDQRI